MPDNKQKVAPQDGARVNVNEDYEVKYWCNKFGCTEEQLKKAVESVGVSKDKVSEYLQSNKS